ncbi:hypothetical protein [Yersinia aleksiciae]|uniref:Lipoprotein n=1 Tax=Yersinia aleksiciae TaxID=263819 RepID=A0A0T9TZP7_YERAE|nr:hypothetical protein [Yersinia aleksiciae]CNL10986.1 Uncharacterised protein [Yersinia aleksiciae]
MRNILFFILFSTSFLSSATVYNFSKRIDEKDSKYDVMVSVSESMIMVTNRDEPSASFKDLAPICKNDERSRLSLLHFDIGDLTIRSMNNIVFISYIVDCTDQIPKVKYVAIYQGEEYVLQGDARVIPANYEWNKINERKFNPIANNNLSNNTDLLEHMIMSWPSQSILIR